ncbi:hypothetical protein DH2020_023437 [Rehmannia glutinosa]|uniref:Myb/SANT-like domain-containing protein n=1 Tax=Rehmannia glutinosa TaxID=99300 RepID=A0ABR0WAJ2_REHGL
MDASYPKIPKNTRKRNDKSRRSWSRREEEVLIASLKEIVANGWKSENGFKIGYLQDLEQEMVKVLPGTDLKGIPHINSKIHVWKKFYGSLVSMFSRSGIGWNDSTCMIECTDEAWAEYVKLRRKRKEMSKDPLVDLMTTSSPQHDARLAEIAKRIGYEYDISTARKEVFGAVGTMQGLSLQEKLLVSKLLIKNTEDLELFFSFPDDARIEFARMKLVGSL